MIAWQFKTRRFTVRLIVEDCLDDPADLFEDKKIGRDILADSVTLFRAVLWKLDPSFMPTERTNSND